VAAAAGGEHEPVSAGLGVFEEVLSKKRSDVRWHDDRATARLGLRRLHYDLTASSNHAAADAGTVDSCHTGPPS